MVIKIKWNDKCVRDGDQKITKKQLNMTKWNPNIPTGLAWQENLYHKLINKG